MSEGAAEGDSGLFGKLPRSRPGTRSPRRAAGAEAGTAAAEAPAEPAEPAGSPREAPSAPATDPAAQAPPPEPSPGPATDEPPAPDEAAEEGGAGLEDLAWAGIAVTAEAATLGIRLFSRAIEAARKATERR